MARRLNPVGNARLTALVGLLLIGPVAVEVVTILLGVHTFMSLHVFIGLALIPVILLKLASTGWRFARYYTRSDAYREHGAPQIAMRLLAPLFVAATVVLFGSGVAMGFLHGQALADARQLHGPASVVWLVLFGFHALVYLRRALLDSRQEIAFDVAGRTVRGFLVASAVAAGVVVGVATIPAQHRWVHLHRGHHNERAQRFVDVASCPPRPLDTSRTITRPRWLSHALVTEYFPVRESWFGGPLVRAAGIRGKHRAAWLYGPHGVAMNGEGLGADGRYYRFAGPYDDGWVNAAGQPTFGCWTGRWSAGNPAWVAAPSRAQFAVGRSPLPFWKTVAVDRKLVPYGSRVFIRAYCDTPAHGWFTALDTGGAIIGAHFDVYRAPPKTLVLRDFHDQKVYVVPPGTHGATLRC